MHKKFHQISAAIQNTDFLQAEVETEHTNTLCKKTGFRNLLQNFVNVLDNQDGSRSSRLPEERGSRDVQTSFDLCPFSNSRFRMTGGLCSSDLPIQKKLVLKRSYPYRKKHSEMAATFERETGSSNPGTSKTMSKKLCTISAASQNGSFSRPREGSSVVVYSQEKNMMGRSKSSNIPFLYASQGSRRFSDETVLLIEDYLSYDYANTARRQNLRNSRRHSFLNCCGRNKHGSTETLTRPLPFDLEVFQETIESMICRICHEGTDVERLIQPCLCKGSIGSVHPRCLKIWLEQSNTTRCELCNYPYAIRLTKKYNKLYSVKIFLKAIVDRRALTYDVLSLIVITPITMAGVIMCTQASMFSPSRDSESETSNKIGNITKFGMFLLCVTIVIAYLVWVFTLVSFHYKSWKKWYANCYDVEVLPVQMTPEERLETSRRLDEEMYRRQTSRGQGTLTLAALNPLSPDRFNFYQTRMPTPSISRIVDYNP